MSPQSKATPKAVSSAKYIPLGQAGNGEEPVFRTSVTGPWKVLVSVLVILLVFALIGTGIIYNELRLARNRLDERDNTIEELQRNCTKLPTDCNNVGTSTSLSATGSTTTQTPADATTVATKACEFGPAEAKDEQPGVFEPLNTDEIARVKDYVRKLGNRVRLVDLELSIPPKSAVLKYLDDGGPQPPREVVVTISQTGMRDEYIIGPLDQPTYHFLNNRTRANQYNIPQDYDGGDRARSSVNTLWPVIKESFFAEGDNCDRNCLRIMSAYGGVKYLMKSKYRWHRVYRTATFDLVHPIDIHFRVNLTINAVDAIYYGGELYHGSPEEFLGKYRNGFVTKIYNPFPEVNHGDLLHLSGDNNNSKRPPRSSMPDGQRFTVDGWHVSSPDWQFHLFERGSTGLRLYDIRYKGERVIYEAGVEEIGVTYSAYGPGKAYDTLIDSPFAIGGQSPPLRPGVDCPEYATFVDMPITGSSRRVLKNAVCVFEHNTNYPLRRHAYYSREHSGLQDIRLIVRTIPTVYNYDYIVEFSFMSNGGVEVSAGATGFLYTHAYNAKEEGFSFEVAPGVAGSIHDHFINFKIDLDIKGTSNRVDRVGVELVNITDSWEEPFMPDIKRIPRKKLRTTLAENEDQAILYADEDDPGFLRFYNKEHKNAYGNYRSYRLLNEGAEINRYPPGVNGESAITWTRYAAAVTQHHDSERHSSSNKHDKIYPPPYTLADYIDNETVVDEDIVAWVTMGFCHIVHTEDLPVTHTSGIVKRFYLLPYNYYELDPSIHSNDQVHTDKSGETVFTETSESTCKQPKFNYYNFINRRGQPVTVT